ncbi:hypothetical protein PGB90_002639 [Kerria lacca]
MLGLEKTYRKRSGKFKTATSNTIFFSENDDISQRGVALLLTREWTDVVTDFKPTNDRIMVIKLNTRPCRLNAFQMWV